VLDGLTLARLGALRDGSGDEDDELAGGAALEVAEVAHVRRVREHHRLWARPAAGRGAPGAGRRRLQHKERRNLHLLTRRSTPLAIPWLLRDDWMDGDRRRGLIEASATFPSCRIRSRHTNRRLPEMGR
jgi:hypothetical protein